VDIQRKKNTYKIALKPHTVTDSHQTNTQGDFFLLKFQFILQSVVIHLAEFYDEGVLQRLGEGHSVGPLRR
jgi:hypothetical protein